MNVANIMSLLKFETSCPFRLKRISIDHQIEKDKYRPYYSSSMSQAYAAVWHGF